MVYKSRVQINWRGHGGSFDSMGPPPQSRESRMLAIEVFPPQPRDLAITLVDWAPMPPDKEMGIWRDVHMSVTGPVAMRYPAVLTKLPLPSTDEAELSVRTELTNATDHLVDAVLKGRIDELTFEQPVHLA